MLPTARCSQTGGHWKPNFNTGHASPLPRVAIVTFGRVAGPGQCPGDTFSTVERHRGVRPPNVLLILVRLNSRGASWAEGWELGGVGLSPSWVELPPCPYLRQPGVAWSVTKVDQLVLQLPGAYPVASGFRSSHRWQRPPLPGCSSAVSPYVCAQRASLPISVAFCTLRPQVTGLRAFLKRTSGRKAFFSNPVDKYSALIDTYVSACVCVSIKMKQRFVTTILTSTLK